MNPGVCWRAICAVLDRKDGSTLCAGHGPLSMGTVDFHGPLSRGAVGFHGPLSRGTVGFHGPLSRGTVDYRYIQWTEMLNLTIFRWILKFSANP